MNNPEIGKMIDDLLYLMVRLRDETDGCPWDKKQSFQSLTPSTLEEAYEVVEAIELGDKRHLKEELGDLLFQIVFYARLGEEENSFSFADIVQCLTEKLVRRHPHVFPDGELHSRRNPDEKVDEVVINQNWERIKSAERAQSGVAGLLGGIAVSLPALTRAAKLQRRASGVGFDWRDATGAIRKVKEELTELEEAMSRGSMAHMTEELGDLLFSCVNLSRHLKVDAESTLRAANLKFSQRFSCVEQAMIKDGRSWDEVSLDEMERYWQAAKSIAKPADSA